MTKQKFDVRSNPFSWKQGFSLIELLISSAIIFFLLLGAGQLALHSMLFKHNCDRSLKTAELMDKKLEYLKSLPYDLLPADGEKQWETVAGEGIKGTYRLSWTVEEISSGLKKVVITCFPTEDPSRKTESVLLLSSILGF